MEANTGAKFVRLENIDQLSLSALLVSYGIGPEANLGQRRYIYYGSQGDSGVDWQTVLNDIEGERSSKFVIGIAVDRAHLAATFEIKAIEGKTGAWMATRESE